MSQKKIDFALVSSDKNQRLAYTEQPGVPATVQMMVCWSGPGTTVEAPRAEA